MRFISECCSHTAPKSRVCPPVVRMRGPVSDPSFSLTSAVRSATEGPVHGNAHHPLHIPHDSASGRTGGGPSAVPPPVSPTTLSEEFFRFFSEVFFVTVFQFLFLFFLILVYIFLIFFNFFGLLGTHFMDTFRAVRLRGAMPPPPPAPSAIWEKHRAAVPDTALSGNGPGEPEPEPEPRALCTGLDTSTDYFVSDHGLARPTTGG